MESAVSEWECGVHLLDERDLGAESKAHLQSPCRGEGPLLGVPKVPALSSDSL